MFDKENISPRLAIDLSTERVNYYGDVIEYILKSEINRCLDENIPISKSDIETFKIEIVKTLLIRHQVERAFSLKIKEKK